MNIISLDKDKVFSMLTDLESEQIERIISITDTKKYCQAICAFSNDLFNTGKNGYIFIGAHDNGTLSGLKVNDKILQLLGILRSDGLILPLPIMSIKSFSFSDGDIIVIETQVSPFPPVRFSGKTWIRVGPRKAIASESEERILIERRLVNVSMFDIRPCLESTLDDIDINLFNNSYLSKAIDKELLKNDNRNIKQKLAALRFFTANYNCITNIGILLFGKNPEYFLPGAYIQFVRFNGKSVANDILNEKKFAGNLITVLHKIESFIDDVIISQIPISTLKEKTIKNYPNWAIRELIINAIMHRDYASNAPIKFYQFEDRIEISNAGGLYGKARPENFPNENDYRNPILAEVMKVLGFVNRFNRGISRVQEELKENENIRAKFFYKQSGAFSVIVNDAIYFRKLHELSDDISIEMPEEPLVKYLTSREKSENIIKKRISSNKKFKNSSSEKLTSKEIIDITSRESKNGKWLIIK